MLYITRSDIITFFFLELLMPLKNTIHSAVYHLLLWGYMTRAYCILARPESLQDPFDFDRVGHTQSLSTALILAVRVVYIGPCFVR